MGGKARDSCHFLESSSSSAARRDERGRQKKSEYESLAQRRHVDHTSERDLFKTASSLLRFTDDFAAKNHLP